MKRTLSFDIDVKIPPGGVAQITCDPLERAFSPEYLRIESPGLWSISEFIVDRETVAKGHFSGWRFARGNERRQRFAKIGVPPLKRGQRLALIVHYHGYAKWGRAFRGAIVGQ